MANFTITISNSLNSFGGIANYWNASYATWGSFKWGEGTNDLPVAVMHVISESLSPLSSIAKFDTMHVISESLGSNSDMTAEEKGDGSGYDYVYPSDVTNPENRFIASYTSGSRGSQTWTPHGTSTDPWS